MRTLLRPQPPLPAPTEDASPLVPGRASGAVDTPVSPPLQHPNPSSKELVVWPAPEMMEVLSLRQHWASSREKLCPTAWVTPPDSGQVAPSFSARLLCGMKGCYQFSGADPQGQDWFLLSKDTTASPPGPPDPRGRREVPTFAVNLAVLVGQGGGLQALAALGAPEAGLVPGLAGKGCQCCPQGRADAGFQVALAGVTNPLENPVKSVGLLPRKTFPQRFVCNCRRLVGPPKCTLGGLWPPILQPWTVSP